MFRFAAGTEIVPANVSKSGVRASTARFPSTRKTSSSPSLIPSASRTAFGRVTCPFDVTFAAASIAVSLLVSKSKDTAPATRPTRRVRRRPRRTGRPASSMPSTRLRRPGGTSDGERMGACGPQGLAGTLHGAVRVLRERTGTVTQLTSRRAAIASSVGVAHPWSVAGRAQPAGRASPPTSPRSQRACPSSPGGIRRDPTSLRRRPRAAAAIGAW